MMFHMVFNRNNNVSPLKMILLFWKEVKGWRDFNFYNFNPYILWHFIGNFYLLGKLWGLDKVATTSQAKNGALIKLDNGH